MTSLEVKPCKGLRNLTDGVKDHDSYSYLLKSGQSSLHRTTLCQRIPRSSSVIQVCDTKLCHPGPERVFAELRFLVWILRGSETVKRHQLVCYYVEMILVVFLANPNAVEVNC